jgi:hypothetical protein
MIKEGDYDWEREGQRAAEAIADAALIDEEPAEDIRTVLEDRHGDVERDRMGEEGPFDEDAHYDLIEADDIEYRENWRYFEKSLKTEARFFSAAAEETLASVFEGLADHKAHDGQSVIVAAGPGTAIPALYRARVFQSAAKLEDALKRPDRDIGSPPPSAAIAGRMNARGISVFYGATDASVAIGEVRPPVGSRVAVGRFELLREVRLLDVNVLRSVYVEGSIFDSSHIGRLQRARFLERLSTQITMPVMPDDEPLDYIVTQTIADFLANRSDAKLDGILYPSVQGITGGVNVALFHKAARVAEIELPEGTDIEVHTGVHGVEGWETDYRVWENAPPPKPEPPVRKSASLFDLSSFIASPPSYHDPYDVDVRDPALRLDLETLTIHHVTAAKFDTEDHAVQRHRFEKKKPAS